MQNCDANIYKVRRLEILDKNKGFIELLQQLSVCGSVSDAEFQKRYHELSSLGDDHLICVIEDHNTAKIIATGSIFIEKKFLRNCGKVGHIEDLVVDSSARGLQLGKKIVEFLADHANTVGCYKVILDCKVENIGFYEKCGFKQKEIQMLSALATLGLRRILFMHLGFMQLSALATLGLRRILLLEFLWWTMFCLSTSHQRHISDLVNSQA